MANNVVVRGRKASGSSRNRAVSSGFWTYVSSAAAGPNFVEVRRRSQAPSIAEDAQHIRRYFVNARDKLSLDEPAS